MNILLVAATQFEIRPLLDAYEWEANAASNLFSSKNDSLRLDILITGVGQVATTYHLTKHLEHHSYDLIINAGICGSFKKEIELGTVVNIVSESFGDLGAEYGDQFLDIFEMKLADENEFPFQNKKLLNHFPLQLHSVFNLPKATSVTLNKVLGKEDSIEKIIGRFNADVANMEGAAFFYTALRTGTPFLELRSVSNFIEPRNKENWKVDLAVSNLNSVLMNLLDELETV